MHETGIVAFGSGFAATAIRSCKGGKSMPLLSGNDDLTSRQWAITALVSQGCTNADIASKIHATEQMVENHLQRILDKTGCWNRTEVALWYLKIRVEKERRSCDRREASYEIGDERRKDDRRRPPQRSPRTHEQHEINLNE